MLNPIQELKLKKAKSLDDESNLIDVHAHLMAVFGWIPLSEFRELPIPALWPLIQFANEERERREEARQATVALAQAWGAKKK